MALAAKSTAAVWGTAGAKATATRMPTLDCSSNNNSNSDSGIVMVIVPVIVSIIAIAIFLKLCCVYFPGTTKIIVLAGVPRTAKDEDDTPEVEDIWQFGLHVGEPF